MLWRLMIMNGYNATWCYSPWWLCKISVTVWWGLNFTVTFYFVFALLMDYFFYMSSIVCSKHSWNKIGFLGFRFKSPGQNKKSDSLFRIYMQKMQFATILYNRKKWKRIPGISLILLCLLFRPLDETLRGCPWINQAVGGTWKILFLNKIDTFEFIYVYLVRNEG